MGTDQNEKKPRILALVPYYRPGYKGGGPIASLEALVRQLGGEFSWVVGTSDRDSGDKARYPDIPEDGCLVKKGQTLLYLRPGLGRWVGLVRLLRRNDFDLLYVNDMFSPYWGVWPLFLHRLGLLKGKPVLVAPRNQFSPGALSVKRPKKQVFLLVARRVGLWNGLCWHATWVEEEGEIRANVGLGLRVWTAPEFPNINVKVGESGACSSHSRRLRIVFLSRISPTKNLEYALSVLERLSCPIQFDVAGPAENEAYLREIKALMAQLPNNISTTYVGPVDPSKVAALLVSYDAMLLPTRGENFGHVILEALAAGCPPIISDRTPWKDLKEKGCGWVIPLKDKDGFRKALMDLNAMSPEDRERMRAAARAYAQAYVEDPEIKLLNLKMFWEVMRFV